MIITYNKREDVSLKVEHMCDDKQAEENSHKERKVCCAYHTLLLSYAKHTDIHTQTFLESNVNASLL